LRQTIGKLRRLPRQLAFAFDFYPTRLKKSTAVINKTEK